MLWEEDGGGEREKGYLFVIMDSVLGSHNCMIHGDYCVLPFYECIYVFVWQRDLPVCGNDRVTVCWAE